MSSDFAFANDIRAAAALRTPRTSRMLLVTFLALLVTFLTWAHFAILDEVKRGNGRVVPSRQTQVVQTLEGGIVGDILVQEGAIVQQGQSLMRIEDTKFDSECGEIRERRAAMAARVARLDAEARGRSEVKFPDQLDQVVPASVATEASVFKMRAQKVAQDVDVLTTQVNRLNGSLKLLDRERELTRKLYEQKVVPEIEMLRLDRQATEMRGQLAEAQSKIANITASFRSQADEDSSVYGALKGKVESISADTIVDDKEKTERPETFYRVMVRTEKNHLGTEANPLPIIPGMVTTVEILTGEKSVLNYLLKPART